MPSLGSFGASRAATEEETFDYIGETFRLHPDAGELEDLDFAIRANNITATGGERAGDRSEAIKATKDYLLRLVHPDDAARFWAHCKKHRQTTEDLVALAKGLTEAIAGFPTPPASDSPGLVRQARPGSPDVSVSPLSRALAIKDGRPDLQLMVLQRDDASPLAS